MLTPDHTIVRSVLTRGWPALADAQTRPLAGATANLCLQLDGPIGRWVLRGHRRDPRPARTRVLAAAHDALRTAGVPVPMLLPTQSGDLVHEDAGCVWTVMRFAPGRPYQYRPTHRRAVARALADFHQAAVDVCLDQTIGYDHPWSAWLAQPDATWQAARDAVPSEWHTRLDTMAAFVELLHRHADPSQILALPTQWTHGDFHGGNLHVYHDTVAAVFDLDALDPRPRVWDVAVALLMTARSGRGNYHLPTDGVIAFLDTYAATRPASIVSRSPRSFSEAERNAMWGCMLASQMPEPPHLASLARHRSDQLPHALSAPLRALATLATDRRRLTRILTESSCPS